MSSKQMAQTQAWQVAHKTCDTKPMGGVLCGSNWTFETEIDFMCLTMIDPATCWLKIVELLVVDKPTIPTGTWGRKGISTHNTLKVPYFDKSSAMIST